MNVDQYGLIADSSWDFGDSCNFTCFYHWCKGTTEPLYIDTTYAHFWNYSWPVRHPDQIPWQNYKNFSRDQAIPLICLLPAFLLKHFLWSCARRGFFLPNIERDYPGTTKHPYPHYIPASDKGPKEFRWFDYADPCLPDFIGLMIIRGKIWWLYPFLPVSFVWCFLSILGFTFSSRWQGNHDFKELFLISTYLKLNQVMAKLVDLREQSRLYFVVARQLDPIHVAFCKHLDTLGL